MPTDTTPTPEAIEGHIRDAQRRKRSAWRLIWMVGGVLFLLLVLSPIAIYLGWRAHGQALLREQIALVPADEPLTTSELAAWYALPAGTRDITPIWMAAIAPFESQAYSQEVRETELPFVGLGESVSLAQGWDATDAREFLARHAEQIAALHAAAQEQGEVRYPRDFRDGIAMVLPEMQQVRSATRALQLEFYTRAQDPAFEPLLANLQTRYKLGETLRHEPSLVALLVRIAVHSIMLADVRELVAHRDLTDEQLVELQTLVRQVDIHDQLPDAMLGERGWVYHSFYMTSLDPRSLESGSPNQKLETNREGDGVTRGEDAAKSLEIFRGMVAAAREPLPKTFEGMDAAERSLHDLSAENPLQRFRYVQTLMMLPATSAVAQADARGEALRNLTDALIASRRYQLQHGSLPNSLSDLTPDFLPPQNAVDPFDGQPLRFLRPSEKAVRLYSIGTDRVDDGGECDPEGMRPDVAVEMELR
jgi:hypothetical protein